MKVVVFTHSLRSDWNHGNAHFLRGVASELLARGARVRTLEPADGWSVENLRRDHGEAAADAYLDAYPELEGVAATYGPDGPDLDRALDGADLVIVHEWNEPELVRRVGEHRASGGGYRLLFHDTHHRAVTAPEEMARFDLRGFDGVLAFGDVVRELYLERGWAERAWTWHEAADVRRFRPLEAPGGDGAEGDLVWIGNWGDEERTEELHEFLLEPARRLGLRATVHGVRYPDAARAALSRAGIRYAGYLPNHLAPAAFARHRVTVHVPRRPYARALPGIPTIRPFEALACGIPLVSAPWEDREGLFTPGEDFLVARDGEEMARHLRALLDDPERAREQAERGRRTVLARHTCAHRVDELLAVCAELGLEPRLAPPRDPAAPPAESPAESLAESPAESARMERSPS